jgi:hypothetical protein
VLQVQRLIRLRTRSPSTGQPYEQDKITDDGLIKIIDGRCHLKGG